MRWGGRQVNRIRIDEQLEVRERVYRLGRTITPSLFLASHEIPQSPQPQTKTLYYCNGRWKMQSVDFDSNELDEVVAYTSQMRLREVPTMLN
jgi:hypothetical protein